MSSSSDSDVANRNKVSSSDSEPSDLEIESDLNANDPNTDDSANDDNQWVVHDVFKSKAEFDDFRNKEHWWSRTSLQSLVSGIKSTFRCNYVKATGPQCAARMYCLESLAYTDESGSENGSNDESTEMGLTFTVYRKNDHTHDKLLNNLSDKVFPDVEEKIIQLHSENKKPAAITFALRADKSIPQPRQPTKRQIKNVIQKHRAAEQGKEPITMKKLTEIVNKYTDIPADEDEAYIVGFERSPRTQKDNKYFRIFMSSPRLMRNAANAKILHSDATHKVTEEKLPLIPVGVSDLNGKFHLVGLMVSSHETTDAYRYAFSCAKNGVMRHTNKMLQPNYLMADADAAIGNAFKLAFESDENPLTIYMCYSHVMGNVDRKYKFTDPENKPDMKNDIRSLHMAANEEMFDIGCKLFVEKWKKKEKEVAKLLQKSFFNKNKNWYTGITSPNKVPTTNNLQERFHGMMKNDQLFRQKYRFKVFIKTALRVISERSREYIMDKKPFAIETTIDDDKIRKYSEAKIKFCSLQSAAHEDQTRINFYMFSDDPSKKIEKKDVEEFEAIQYTSFDQFAANHQKITKVSFPRNGADWRSGYCSCQQFSREYSCVHIIAIAIKLGMLEPPEADYDDEPLFKAKVGGVKKPSKKPLSLD